jgi:hypothetical protein
MRTAPPATYGVAADVPLPTLSPDLVVSGPSVAHELQSSEARVGVDPGHGLTKPESVPPTMIGDGPRCGASSVGCPTTPNRKATPLRGLAPDQR